MNQIAVFVKDEGEESMWAKQVESTCADKDHALFEAGRLFERYSSRPDFWEVNVWGEPHKRTGSRKLVAHLTKDSHTTVHF